MKTVPAVMFVEMAVDAIKTEDPAFLEKEAKEFSALGDPARDQVLSLHPDPMTAGYLLGLETARMLLASMPAAVVNKVNV